jgi:hypothetical protein
MPIDYTKSPQNSLHPAYWDAREFTPKLCPIPPTRTPTRPRLPITNPDFDYTPARATNVAETWRKHGWKAPLKPQ